MSDYRAGDLIRLARQAIGMSQETLCENICSVQTLSRIENGKVNVKRDIYSMLMERMGRSEEKIHSVLKTEDFDTWELFWEIGREIARYDYAIAEKKLEQLKLYLKEEESIVNRQQVQRLENLIQYRQKKIEREEYLERQEGLLTLTVPDYRKLLDKVYPFRNVEIQILMNIANAKADGENIERAIKIYYMLIRSLNCGYMRKSDSERLISMFALGLSKRYGELEEYGRAANLCRNGIGRAKQHKFISVLPGLYGELAWNIMKQIEEGKLEKKERETVKNYLRQSYASAILSLQHNFAQISKAYYRKWFGEEIY